MGIDTELLQSPLVQTTLTLLGSKHKLHMDAVTAAALAS